MQQDTGTLVCQSSVQPFCMHNWPETPLAGTKEVAEAGCTGRLQGCSLTAPSQQEIGKGTAGSSEHPSAPETSTPGWEAEARGPIGDSTHWFGPIIGLARDMGLPTAAPAQLATPPVPVTQLLTLCCPSPATVCLTQHSNREQVSHEQQGASPHHCSPPSQGVSKNRELTLLPAHPHSFHSF